MSKDKLKVTKNQHCNANSSYNRLMRRSRAFWRLEKAGVDPQWLYNYINSKMGVGKELTPQLLEHILYMASRGLFCFASTKWLGSLMDCHEKSVCRISRELADLGIIRKWYRGVGRSVALLLNPLFNNPVIQFTLGGLFPFLKAGTISLLISADGHALKSLPSFARSDLATHVTYNKNLTLLRNSTSCSVVKAKQSGGETPVKRSVTERGVPELPYWTHGERKSAELMRAFGPMEETNRCPYFVATAGEAKVLNVYPRKLRTATAAKKTSSIKRSGEYLFDPQQEAVEATNESFDLFDVTEAACKVLLAKPRKLDSILGEREMLEKTEPDLSEPEVVPFFEEGGEWEEVSNFPISEEAPETKEASPMGTLPIELPLETKKEKVESFRTAPVKPWNAPPWRKVAAQQDIETLEEFVMRQIEWRLQEREKNETRTTIVGSERRKYTERLS